MDKYVNSKTSKNREGRFLFGKIRFSIAFFVLLFSALSPLNASFAAEFGVPWETEFKIAMQKAEKTNRMVLIHFYGDHCPPCRRMDREVFALQSVADALNPHFVPLKIDTSTNEKAVKNLNITSIPADLIVTPQREIIHRRDGWASPRDYVEDLLAGVNRYQLIQQQRMQNLQFQVRPDTPGTAIAPSVAKDGNLAAISGNTPPMSINPPASHDAFLTHLSVPRGHIANVNSNPQFFAGRGENPFPPLTPPKATVRNTEGQTGNVAAPSDVANAVNPAGNPHERPVSGPKNPENTATGESGIPEIPQKTIQNEAPEFEVEDFLQSEEEQKQDSTAFLGPNPQWNFDLSTTEMNEQEKILAESVPLRSETGKVALTNYTNEPAKNANSGSEENAFDFSGLNFDQIPPNSAGTGRKPDSSRSEAGPENAESITGLVIPRRSPEMNQELTPHLSYVLDGFCPVELQENERWVAGKGDHALHYHNQYFLFSSAEAMGKFSKHPPAYTPVAMGEDIVQMVKFGERVKGMRNFGAWYQGKIYLFSTQENYESFAERPSYYAALAAKLESAFGNTR